MVTEFVCFSFGNCTSANHYITNTQLLNLFESWIYSWSGIETLRHDWFFFFCGLVRYPHFRMVTWCEKASCFGNFPIVQTSLGGSRLNLPQLPDGAHRYHRWNIQIHTATKIIHKTDLLWYLLPYGNWSIMIIYDIYYPMDPAVASERNYDLRRWFRKKKTHFSESVWNFEGYIHRINRRISLLAFTEDLAGQQPGHRLLGVLLRRSRLRMAEIHGEFSASWSIINHEIDRSMWKFTRE